MISDCIGAFHHVGLAVPDIDSSRAFFERTLGANVESEVFHDPLQGVRIQFIQAGGLRIELLAPAAAPCPLDGILKRGVGLYHAGYETVEFDEKVRSIGASGMSLVSPPKPAVAFGGRRVAFFMGRGLIIELIEGIAEQVNRIKSSQD